MRRFLLLLACLVLAFTAGAARRSNLLYGPWVSDVSETGFTVLWVTEEPSLDYVVLAPDDGTSFEKTDRPHYYQTAYGRRVSGRYHTVHIDGLEPGTSYRYRLVGQVIKDDSDPYRIVYGAKMQISPGSYSVVRTLSAESPQCRFSVFNDIHFDDARFTALASGVDVASTDFLLLNGDIVSYCQSIDSVAKHCIRPITAQAARLPIIYARGNHEGRGRDFDKFYGLFPTPTGEFWFSFRQGPAAFIVLDAGEDKPDKSHEYGGQADYDSWRQVQTEWLKEAVKAPSFVSAPQKICIMHVPTINFKNSWYSQVWITENWGPILEEAGIDLMISAHHHKWICSPAGEDGKAYPVLVNSNMERMDVVVTPEKITVATFDVNGAMKHSWEK